MVWSQFCRGVPPWAPPSHAARGAHGGTPLQSPQVKPLTTKVTMEQIRYSVAACQTDLPNPVERRAMRANTDRMLSMIDSAVIGSAPFLPVRLVVFPEFAHAVPVFPSVGELLEILAVHIPNEHNDRLDLNVH